MTGATGLRRGDRPLGLKIADGAVAVPQASRDASAAPRTDVGGSERGPGAEKWHAPGPSDTGEGAIPASVGRLNVDPGVWFNCDKSHRKPACC
jgi:hypothetical protein